MLINHTRLTNTPVLSLHLGGRVAVATTPILNPANLRIVAFTLNTPTTNGSRQELFLLANDIREYGPLGFIVDSTDDFVQKGDVIRLDEIIALNFDLLKLTVYEEGGRKLGKVHGYVVDASTFEVQQISVKQGLIKSIAETGGLLIHRSQIIEINDTSIIVKSTKQPLAQPTTEQTRGAFVNPFRAANQSPQPDSASRTSS